MKCFAYLGLAILFLSKSAWAEQGCPPGMIQGGAWNPSMATCVPIPQDQQQPPSPPRPTGRWIKTWGAIAIGTVDSIPYYGVPTGAMSESEAKQQALDRCAKRGPQNCKIALTYNNQCAAIAEPQINNKPNPDGFVQFTGGATIEKASNLALDRCQQRNPEMQCKVIYKACSEPIFEKF